MGQSIERTNIELVVQAGELIRSGFVDRDHHPFADDFVLQFINPHSLIWPATTTASMAWPVCSSIARASATPVSATCLTR